MRRLLPGPPVELDPFDAYQDQPDRWLRVGMALSVDGSVTDRQGWTDGLGGEADRRVFRALRAVSDGILVGATTIRTGRVGPHRLPEELRARRAAIGKPAPAPVIVVTRSLRLDWSHRLFTEAASPTIVITCADAMPGWPPGTAAHPLVAGGTEVDLPEAVRRLRTEHGLGQLLCEGGPVLATAMTAAGLVDELCLTIAPALIGAGHHTRPFGHLDRRPDLTLTALYESDGVIFSRYRLLRSGEVQD
ncbi:MAG: deaminase [Micromonosporaceae bacterium]|nr:deaminase [Micromonosporaceae bacterium]